MGKLLVFHWWIDEQLKKVKSIHFHIASHQNPTIRSIFNDPASNSLTVVLVMFFRVWKEFLSNIDSNIVQIMWKLLLIK